MKDSPGSFLFFLLPSFAIALSGFAQGTVNFKNRVLETGIDAPIYVYCGIAGSKADGTNFLAMLLGGPLGGPLVPVSPPVPFRTGAAAGYIYGSTVTISNIPPGGPASVQMLAWNAYSFGDDYTMARQSGMLGSSQIINLERTGDPTIVPPSKPADLVGLRRFAAEPAVLDVPPCDTSLVITKTSATVSVNWAATDIPFRLEYATRLSPPDWRQFPGILITNKPGESLQNYEVRASAAQGTGFFRLVAP